MDNATIQMLQDLPTDLKAQGWRLSLRSTGTTRNPQSPRVIWHKAVYVRPLHHGLEDEHSETVTVLQEHDQFLFTVSTYTARCRSWEEAYQEAVKRMRAADAQLHS